MLTFNIINENNNECWGTNSRGNWNTNKNIKNNKSPGEDEIQAELLKKGEKELVKGYGI